MTRGLLRASVFGVTEYQNSGQMSTSPLILRPDATVLKFICLASIEPQGDHHTCDYSHPAVAWHPALPTGELSKAKLRLVRFMGRIEYRRDRPAANLGSTRTHRTKKGT